MIGIALIAFDRPQYMRRLLASLEQQTDLEGVTVHLFQDGPINAFSGRKAGSGEGIVAHPECRDGDPPIRGAGMDDAAVQASGADGG